MTLRVVAFCAGFVALSAATLTGQEPTSGSKKVGIPAKVGRGGADPVRRVPNYFGQIGLTPEQREKIYQVRGKHQETLDSLKRQIEESERAMLEECESVLTDSQKGLLRQRRESAKSAGSTKAGSPTGSP